MPLSVSLQDTFNVTFALKIIRRITETGIQCHFFWLNHFPVSTVWMHCLYLFQSPFSCGCYYSPAFILTTNLIVNLYNWDKYNSLIAHRQFVVHVYLLVVVV